MSKRIRVGDTVEWIRTHDDQYCCGVVLEIISTVARVQLLDSQEIRWPLISKLTRIDSEADRATMQRDMEREIYQRIDAEDRRDSMSDEPIAIGDTVEWIPFNWHKGRYMLTKAGIVVAIDPYWGVAYVDVDGVQHVVPLGLLTRLETAGVASE